MKHIVILAFLLSTSITVCALHHIQTIARVPSHQSSVVTAAVKQVIDHVKQHKDSYGTAMATCACFYFFYRLRSTISKKFKNKLNAELAQLFSADNQNYADIEALIQAMITVINKGADVNTANAQGDPLLIWATRNGHTDLVKIVLEKKGAVNIRGQEATTALIQAAGKQRFEILDILLQQENIDVDLQDNNDTTALIAAMSALSNNEALANRLLQAHAKIDTQDKTLSTALMYAATNNLYDCVYLLLNDLRQQPDLSLKNNLGKTALHIATDAGHSEIVELLSNHTRHRIESNPYTITARTQSNSINNDTYIQ